MTAPATMPPDRPPLAATQPAAAAALAAADPAAVASGVGLEILATARWPERAGDPQPSPVAGFIASSFSPLVAEVAHRCLRRRYGNPPADPASAGRTAVVIASGSGDVVTALTLAQAVDERRRISPLLFFQAVPNAVAGHIAARWGLAGPVVCIGTAGDEIGEGLAAAALLIDDGDADEALVICAEQDHTAAGADRAVAMLTRRSAAGSHSGAGRTADSDPPPPTEGVLP